MACGSCPVEFGVESFAVMVADGWGQQHTFRAPEFNDGQVIFCTGRFHLAPPAVPADGAGGERDV